MNDDLASQLEPLHLDAFGCAVHCCSGDRSRAEDVLQTAYLKVLQGTARKTGDGPLKTWWFGVIRLTAKEEARKLNHRESLLGRMLGRLFPSIHDTPDSTLSPADQIELCEQAEYLRTLLAQLPERQATVLHLVFYQDLSLSEAAGVLGLSLGSVRQHYDRGKARMRTLLQPTPAR